MKQTQARNRGRPKSFHDKSESAVIQSLDRAIDVLKTVAAADGLSLTEIAEAGGQSPATVYRILTTFARHRFAEFDEVNQLWFVGLEAFRTGMGFLGRTQLSDRARPIMQRIMAETGETANLAILDGGEVIFVGQIETHEPIRAFFRPGTRSPGHASGIGKAIMAHFDEEALAARLPLELTAHTPSTITDHAALKRELAEIRARGWAVDNEERTQGMRCIAAPVFNSFGEAVAGVSLSGPSVRVRPERDAEFGALIARAADEITRSTGGMPPRT